LNGIPSVAAKSAGALHEFFNVRSQGARLPEGAGRWQAASGHAARDAGQLSSRKWPRIAADHKDERESGNETETHKLGNPIKKPRTLETA